MLQPVAVAMIVIAKSVVVLMASAPTAIAQVATAKVVSVVAIVAAPFSAHRP
ncbi:MAG: hypothetical protein QF408_03080 [Pirellulales bacterium]|jgi:hypothetical protein|nr:hypothetical protein [Pirellulales bacterium]HJN66435.1 hypothetical protein [Pirellulales bacterium]